MFETNSRACDIQQVMKEGPASHAQSVRCTPLPLPLSGVCGLAQPLLTLLSLETPAAPVSSYYLLSPCLLLQALRRAVGSVSTPSAPVSFFLLSPAFTASQGTSAGPGLSPHHRPDTSPHRNPHEMGALIVPIVWRRKWAQTGWATGFSKAAADPVLNPRQCPGQSHPWRLPIMVALSQPSSCLSAPTGTANLSSRGSWEPVSPCSFLPPHRVGSPELYPWPFTLLMIENLPRETRNPVETSRPRAQGHAKSVAGRVS